MSTRIVLETSVIVGSLVYKCGDILAYGYIDPWIHYSLGYFLFCVVCLVSLSVTPAESKIKHTRKGVGGTMYALLIPMINLDVLSRTPATSPSYQALQAQVAMDQVQMSAVIAVSILAHFSRRNWPLFCILLALGSIWLQSSSGLSLLELLPAVLSSAQSLWMLLTVFDVFPQTFSFGEGVVVSQAWSLVTFHISSFFMKIMSPFGAEQSSYDSIATISACSLLSPAVVYTFLPTGYRHPSLYYFMSCVGLLLALLLSLWLGHLQSIATSIVTEYAKMLLIIWWVGIAAAAVSLVLLYNMKKWRVSSVDRKYFHLMAVMIFLPGIFLSPQLTKLASIAALVLFIVLEFVRYMKLPYYGELLHEGLTIFLDKRQDSGSLILTHIYLLSGCALPLWFSAFTQLSEQNLSLYAGIISLGVGDSCASIFGSRYGRLCYPGSSKTVEGTLAAWLSMALFSSTIIYPTVGDLCSLSMRLLLVAVLESCTQQVDNLILPLYTYVILSYSGF